MVNKSLNRINQNKLSEVINKSLHSNNHKRYWVKLSKILKRINNGVSEMQSLNRYNPNKLWEVINKSLHSNNNNRY